MVNGKLPAGLNKISAAPLKPQQKIRMLKASVIPGILNRLVLGKATATSLKAADITMRACVRRWLQLPHETPLGNFHTTQKHGGLVLPCLQHLVPLHCYNRYTRITESLEGSLNCIKQSKHVNSTLHHAKQAIAFLGETATKNTLNEYWRRKLLNSVDGSGLDSIGKHRSETSWNSTLDHLISGEDYVQHHAVRFNAIPSRKRTSRGRKHENNRAATLCRGGCRVP